MRADSVHAYARAYAPYVRACTHLVIVEGLHIGPILVDELRAALLLRHYSGWRSGFRGDDEWIRSGGAASQSPISGFQTCRGRSLELAKRGVPVTI